MPKQWTAKQERQYQHITESEKDQGASTKRAKEVAARTVNKNRAQAGQTKTASRSSVKDKSPQQRGGERSGRQGPKGRTRDQLYNEARQRNIEGRSKMNKSQLEAALRRKKNS
ncbi:plasmid stabilization protein [Nocardia salmonicida]|uniref:plasmid stabilization protein n=1 Tax=Nocardia salmonicida TaxID=53431 RepID=UPI0033FA334A